MSKQNNTNKAKVFRAGGYSTLVSVIVIAAVIVVNLLVTNLNISWDISDSGLYTLTDTTKDLLKGLNDDVTIYYIAADGREDERIREMVDLYGNSSKVSVELRDPNLYPDFVSKYVDTSSTTITNNSLIVVNNVSDRSKYVTYNSMIKTQTSSDGYSQTMTGYDVEGQVTSAISYVTTDNLPTIYVTTGHDEGSLTSTIREYISKQNIAISTLNTLTDTIPEDCAALIVINPVSDFNESETQMINEYLDKGGDLIAFTSYIDSDLPNFQAILENYGIGMAQGMVMEQDASRTLNQIPYALNPEVLSAAPTKSIISANKMVAMLFCRGLTTDVDVRSSVTVEPLLQTSDEAFGMVDITTGTFSKGENDVDGPFYLGIASSETQDDGSVTHVVAYSSPSLVSTIALNNSLADFTMYSSFGNADLFTDTVNYAIDRTDSGISIPAKDFSQKYVQITSANIQMLAVLAILVIPAAFMVIGIVQTVRRRRL